MNANGFILDTIFKAFLQIEGKPPNEHLLHDQVTMDSKSLKHLSQLLAGLLC